MKLQKKELERLLVLLNFFYLFKAKFVVTEIATEETNTSSLTVIRYVECSFNNQKRISVATKIQFDSLHSVKCFTTLTRLHII